MKYFVRTLLLAMIISITGCGGGNEENTTGNVTVKSTSATLSWVAPTTSTDGSPLAMTEIGGYKVYMGTSATDLTVVADVSDPYTMEYEISSLDDGVYYFAVSTTSIDGVESDLSAVVSKTI